MPWQVLPTRVGMVRIPAKCCPPRCGSPHARGDGPVVEHAHAVWIAFSPRAWGWSVDRLSHVMTTIVLPTRVGMVRGTCNVGILFIRSPHARGDGPFLQSARRWSEKFSPRAWGWSVTLTPDQQRKLVLPTRVGMVRKRGPVQGVEKRSPHARGDGPSWRDAMQAHAAFSPRAWGWSGQLKNENED